MKIEHVYFPGFVMEVLGVEPCDPDAGDPRDAHDAYKVIDPEGAEDAVCSRMVRIVEA